MAFIMDGNRRYAVNNGMKKKSDGHFHGFQSLKRCLEWNLELGVQIVTVFAFAIENFQREKNEVQVLMNLAKTKLKEMAEEGDFLDQHDIKVNIIGDLQLLPQDVLLEMNNIMELTKNHKKMIFNICFAYNSSNEIQNAIEKTIKQKKEGLQQSQKEQKDKKGIIQYEDFFQNLMIPNKPDIIVRTSNEIRLSNFMTIQSSNSQLCFLEENWPEISIFSMLKIILKYQVTEKHQKIVDNQLKSIIKDQKN